ncbi:MAG: hypothetical protein HDR00_01005 [Lachnospiraceae bacterium]|nr:hypothetical protein [Lachnospiraceae bacterium]
MEQVFIRILYMSMTAGYCALIVMALRFLIHRLPKIYSYGLWLVVFLRFLCPVFPESSYSLVKFEPQEIWQDVSYDLQMPVGETGTTNIMETLSLKAGMETIQSGDSQQGNVLMEGNENDGVEKVKRVSWVKAAGFIWLAGAVALAFYSFRSALMLKKQLADAKCQGENIYEADNLRTPFVLGVIKPCIYLPSALEPKEREVVLVHEKIHIRRKDYLIKTTAFLIVAVHWFNPLAWISYYLMCKDMEMSCDENVVEKMGQEIKKDYSTSLLSLASGRKMEGARLTAFGEGNVRKRIVRVLRYKRPSMKAGVVGSVVLVAAMAGLLFNSVKVSAGQNAVWDILTKSGNAGAVSYIQNSSGQYQELIEDAKGLFAGKEEAANLSEQPYPADYQEPVVHLYVPDFYIENGYTDLNQMTEEEASGLAQKALYDLYETTGTKIEECYYFYTVFGDFHFGLTPEDLEHSRIFYSRSFGSDEREDFVSIPSMYLANARSVWYSTVYQYKLPAGFETMSDEEKAVWFVTNSSLYNGQEVVECSQPYSYVSSTWQVYMADGTTYEIDLENITDSFGHLTGPYPDRNIGH